VKEQEIFLEYEKRVAEFKLQLIRKLAGSSSAHEKPEHKRTSNIEMAAAVLKAAGKPLHVSDVIDEVKQRFDVMLDRDSLSSAITKQIKKGKRFVRVAPNTFDLRSI